MKPVMKTVVSGQRSAVRDENGNTNGQQEMQAAEMPVRERASETTLQFDESIGCYRWGVKGK